MAEHCTKLQNAVQNIYDSKAMQFTTMNKPKWNHWLQSQRSQRNGCHQIQQPQDTMQTQTAVDSKHYQDHYTVLTNDQRTCLKTAPMTKLQVWKWIKFQVDSKWRQCTNATCLKCSYQNGRNYTTQAHKNGQQNAVVKNTHSKLHEDKTTPETSNTIYIYRKCNCEVKMELQEEADQKWKSQW